MKTIILTLITLIFWLGGIAQENKSNDLYLQALNQFFNPVAFADTKNNKIYEGWMGDSKDKPIDTILVQKENYLPDVWPEKIKQHVIIYLSKAEINDFKGKYVSLMTMSPIRKSGTIYYMKMTNYGKKNEGWSSWGYHEFKFLFDAKTNKYSLAQPIITLCNSL